MFNINCRNAKALIIPKQSRQSIFMVLFRTSRNVALGLLGTFAVASAGHAADQILHDQNYTVSAPVGATDLCLTYSWSCRSSNKRAKFSSVELAAAHRENTRVNRTVREISDQDQYHRGEVWSLPTNRGGDCEDFALLKQRELIAAGIAAERLLIATVLDRERAAHAVLILRTDHEDLVLDNMTDTILPWHSTGYSFLRMQNPANKKTWVAVMRGGAFDTDQREVLVADLRQ